jgi:hypothetical protein
MISPPTMRRTYGWGVTAFVALAVAGCTAEDAEPAATRPSVAAQPVISGSTYAGTTLEGAPHTVTEGDSGLSQFVNGVPVEVTAIDTWAQAGDCDSLWSYHQVRLQQAGGSDATALAASVFGRYALDVHTYIGCTQPGAAPAGVPPPATLDPQFDTCGDLFDAGYPGGYVQGTDPEYDWYIDGDNDGIACEPSDFDS